MASVLPRSNLLFSHISSPLIVSFSAILISAILVRLLFHYRPFTSRSQQTCPRPPNIGVDPGPFSVRLQQSHKHFQKHGSGLIQQAYIKNKSQVYYLHSPPCSTYVLPPQHLPFILSLLRREKDNGGTTTLSQRESHDIIFSCDDHIAQRIKATLVSNLSESNLPRAPLLRKMSKELDRSLRNLRNINTNARQWYTAYYMKELSEVVNMAVLSVVLVGFPTCWNGNWWRSAERWGSLGKEVRLEKLGLGFWARVSRFLGWEGEKEVLQGKYVDVIRDLFGLVGGHRVERDRIGSGKGQRKERGKENRDRDDEDDEDVEDERGSEDVLMWSLEEVLREGEGEGKGQCELGQGLLANVARGLLDVGSHGAKRCSQVLSACLVELFRREGGKYLVELRSEALKHLGMDEDHWTVDKLRGLERLNSFIKEVMRLNSGRDLGLYRKVNRRLELPDGTILAPGCSIAFPLFMMDRDPDICGAGEAFDGYRFCRKPGPQQEDSQDDGKEGIELMQTPSRINDNDLTWGEGKTACPGRSYAMLQVRLVLVKFLLKYDYRLADRENHDGTMERNNEEVWLRSRECME